jgi:hypothetical protein
MLMPQVIEEETSDEDNSSNQSNNSKKEKLKPIKRKEPLKNQPKLVKDLLIVDKKSGRNFDDTNSYDQLRHDKNEALLNNMEEKKVGHHKNSSSFSDIRDSYDFIRKHRSGSCKSAAASLKFTKKRNSIRKFSNRPLAGLSCNSRHLSTSTSKGKNVSSFVGISNIKTSELSLGDSVKMLQSNSRCLSDVSWNLTHQESDDKKSLPLVRYDSSGSLLSGNSAKGGNTSTTTLTSKNDFNWDFRSLRNASSNMPRLDTHMEEFPYSKRQGMMSKPLHRIVDTLPELIECEEILEEEYDIFSIRHNRINIMEDLNEFGRKNNKRHRSLDGRSKKQTYNANKANRYVWDSDVSETEEEDWISDDSNKGRGEPISKISRIFNKIYADLFERPIRMKQIKERSRRNINTLGDNPINEDSNDSSNKNHEEEEKSDASSSTISFRKRDVQTLFDGLDRPKKTLSCSTKFYEQIEDPILEDMDEYPTHTYDTKSEIVKFKSRHDKGTIFKKYMDRKDKMPNNSSINIRSISFDNEPILEDIDEYNEFNDNKVILSHLN